MQQVTVVDQEKAAVLRGVVGMEQQGARRADVAKAAAKRMQASPYWALRSITCEFHSGILVLCGQVPSFYLKQIPQETVRTVDCVGMIVNVVAVA